jgi:glycosyltransferase involved in cell wall biosynthesis
MAVNLTELGGARPRVSVIVRSYNRLAALAELLTVLLAQDHDSFEVVVVEQSTVKVPGDLARVEQLARDPRVRLLEFSPLGGPGARNAGVRAALGELLVFIDDDDLPASTDWLRRHETNFGDPKCLGVTGRFVGEHGEDATARTHPTRIRRGPVATCSRSTCSSGSASMRARTSRSASRA